MNIDVLATALTVGLVVVAVVLAVRFELFILRDIAQAPGARYLTKPAWALLSILSIPLGGILWWYYGRRR